jgi:hypothetical protein
VHTDAGPASPEVEAIDFRDLGDGRLLELIEDPGDPLRTALLLWDKGGATVTRRIEHCGKTYIPRQRDTEVLKAIKLPRGIKPCKSVSEGALRVGSLLNTCVALELLDWYFVVSASVSSWWMDRFSIAPYLSIIGPPGSGKTTLLKILALVCWRSLLVADASTASLYAACREFTPSVLVDEVCSHTSQSRRSLFHLLRTGSTRDVLAMKTDQIRHSFGFKALASINPIEDVALNSRCVVVQMAESWRTNLMRPDHPHIQRWAADIRAFLFYLRLAKHKTIRPARIPGMEELRPRDREQCSVVAAPFIEDKQWCEALVEFFRIRSAKRPNLLGPREEAVLVALFSLAHLPLAKSAVTVGGVAGLAREVLRMKGERIPLADRKAGGILTSFGISRSLTNRGYAFWWDLENLKKIHDLVQRYGVDGPWIPGVLLQMGACQFCQPPARRLEEQGDEPQLRDMHISRRKAKKRKKR